LKEGSPLVWDKPRQNNSTINDAIIKSFKKNYPPPKLAEISLQQVA